MPCKAKGEKESEKKARVTVSAGKDVCNRGLEGRAIAILGASMEGRSPFSC